MNSPRLVRTVDKLPPVNFVLEDLELLIERIKTLFTKNSEFHELVAKEEFSKLKAYINSGFTREEAFQLLLNESRNRASTTRA